MLFRAQKLSRKKEEGDQRKTYKKTTLFLIRFSELIHSTQCHSTKCHSNQNKEMGKIVLHIMLSFFHPTNTC